jgi:HJR/Mrr/RecB family endonuclease
MQTPDSKHYEMNKSEYEELDNYFQQTYQEWSRLARKSGDIGRIADLARELAEIRIDLKRYEENTKDKSA